MARKPLTFRVRVPKEQYRRMQFPDGVTISHLYPTLADWPAGSISDAVNPRSHEENVIQRGRVPQGIRTTIRDNPDMMYLVNRGITLLAESCQYDPHTQMATISIEDIEQHGIVDGATTDRVVAGLKVEMPENSDELRRALIHVEVTCGLADREEIALVANGRNTSQQVKSWTLENFGGSYEWLKALLDRPGSPFFGRIGWEENAKQEATVLDVLALLTLVHPNYNESARVPTIAYSSKGTLDKRFTREDWATGYRMLSNVAEDLLQFHDYLHLNFEAHYLRAFPKGKLGGRKAFFRRSTVLPLTGQTAEFDIPEGIIFPMLAAFRPLIEYRGGVASWKKDKAGRPITPRTVLEDCGGEIMENLFGLLGELANDDPQKFGKKAQSYRVLTNIVKLAIPR